VAAALAAPQLAAADDVQEQLRVMQERMGQLEEKIQAQDDQLEAADRKAEQQQRLIEESGIDRAGQSWLSSFLSQTTFDGFVAASYTYNFNDPSDSMVASDFCLGTSGATGIPLPPGGGPLNGITPTGTTCGENTSLFGNVAPHHQNANNFQVDEVWFGMEKAATNDSRGGFRVDIVYGAAADAQGHPQNQWLGNGFINFAAFDSTGDVPHVYQAYAQYLAPLTENGISIKAGRYETVIGAESFRMDRNFNVTRGIIWGIQPVNHTGVLVEGSCTDCGVDWALGISNNFGNTMSDTDNAKTGIGRVRWTGETASIAVAGLLGGDVGQSYAGQVDGIIVPGVGVIPVPGGVGRDADWIPMLNVVTTWDPSENLSMWLDYTHIFDPQNGNTPYDVAMWGLAGAARLAINDLTGISTRLEYLNYNSIFQSVPGWSGDAEQWSVTATLDRALTDHLTVSVEGRYDYGRIEGAPDDIFITKCDPLNPGCFGQGNAAGIGGLLGLGVVDYDQDSQFLGLVQLMYEF
jgi:hypothetical protein